MLNVKTVKTGHLAVAKKKTVLKTGSVGSCIVITLYDKESGIGGLAHAILPTRYNEFIEDDGAPAKFADTAVDNLIHKIESIGAKRENLVAKLIGGASMFKNLPSQIGNQNIQSAQKRLSELNIHIENEDTSGSVGKNVELDTSTGIVKITTLI